MYVLLYIYVAKFSFVSIVMTVAPKFITPVSTGKVPQFVSDFDIYNPLACEVHEH